MRYHIDTIPVWDAMKLNSECPLCAIRRKTECVDIDRFLGSSVMEPDVRIVVNDLGFCGHHQELLFLERNKLGHALMLHTYMAETLKKLTALYQSALPVSGKKRSLQAITTGNRQTKVKTNEILSEKIKQLTESCVICDSLKDNMNRYAYTFMHLWKTSTEFKRVFSDCKGLCIPDSALLLSTASAYLNGSDYDTFSNELVRVQLKNLKRVEEELKLFTLKFDYRNQDKPWGESRNAIERTINKLHGWHVGEEPNPKAK